jgi:hypothetical protein
MSSANIHKSLPVQEYYAANIKENNVLIPLLEFMFDFLQKAHGKIIDPTRFDIQSFQPDESENAEKETQWLLVHLYYLSLRHLANMTKNWWIDTKKRVKGPVEGWTEKYVSHYEPEPDSLARLITTDFVTRSRLS